MLFTVVIKLDTIVIKSSESIYPSSCLLTDRNKDSIPPSDMGTSKPKVRKPLYKPSPSKSPAPIVSVALNTIFVYCFYSMSISYEFVHCGK